MTSSKISSRFMLLAALGVMLFLEGVHAGSCQGSCATAQGLLQRGSSRVSSSMQTLLGDEVNNSIDCSSYMEHTGCGWTRQWNCPSQPAGKSGAAGDDGSEGYACCCTQELWKPEQQDCSSYMNGAQCGWTKEWNCPTQPPGSSGAAGDDGSEGYACCCKEGLWNTKRYDEDSDAQLNGLVNCSHPLVVCDSDDMLSQLPWEGVLSKACWEEKKTCESTHEEQGEGVGMRKSVRNACPLTCGLAAGQYSKEWQAGYQMNKISCSGVKSLCLDVELGAKVQEACPTTCGLFPVYDNDNSLKTIFEDRDLELKQFASCDKFSSLCNDDSFGQQMRTACPHTCSGAPLPTLPDNDAAVTEKSGGKVTACSQAKDMCQHAGIGSMMREACPATCGVRLVTLPDNDAAVTEKSGGKVTACSQAKDMCHHAAIGSMMREACPATCRVPAVDSNEAVKKNSGGKVTKCSQAKDMCFHSEIGPMMREACPLTCGLAAVHGQTKQSNTKLQDTISCSAVTSLCRDGVLGPVLNKYCRGSCGGFPALNSCSELDEHVCKHAHFGHEVNEACPNTCSGKWKFTPYSLASGGSGKWAGGTGFCRHRTWTEGASSLHGLVSVGSHCVTSRWECQTLCRKHSQGGDCAGFAYEESPEACSETCLGLDDLEAYDKCESECKAPSVQGCHEVGKRRCVVYYGTGVTLTGGSEYLSLSFKCFNSSFNTVPGIVA
eukprot:TRINITY_DN4651_c0_g1_i1.p1 TRINITY_DN4651_c0_g1~~TRINITY_DN4651_c0_g1_i1.p1  ORF type:complete len:717 (-),score=101.93 TRINITY_DN4651_c0_g1_i1:84-2234(-)